MFNQKIRTVETVEFDIEQELLYEIDPCELKLDEMRSPLPIATLNSSSMFSRRDCLKTAKPFPTVRRRWIRWISLSAIAR